MQGREREKRKKERKKGRKEARKEDVGIEGLVAREEKKDEWVQ